MSHSNEIKLCQDNILTQARYNFSLYEKRVLYQVIGKINNIYPNESNYYDDVVIHLSKEQLLECGAKEKIKEIYKALESLNKRSIQIDNAKEWLVVNYINYAHHDKQSDTWEVQISKKIVPYFVKLSKNFTTYNLTIALTFRSIYTQRFYELCSQYRNLSNKTFFLEIDKMKEIFFLEDKYPNFYDLKKRVIDVAQKELETSFEKGQSKLYFEYTPDEKTKKGRSYTRIFFHIKENTKEEIKATFKNTMAAQRRLLAILQQYIINDIAYIGRVSMKLLEDPTNVIEIVSKLENRILDYPYEDMPKLIRHILREDYNIE